MSTLWTRARATTSSIVATLWGPPPRTRVCMAGRRTAHGSVTAPRPCGTTREAGQNGVRASAGVTRRSIGTVTSTAQTTRRTLAPRRRTGTKANTGKRTTKTVPRGATRNATATTRTARISLRRATRTVAATTRTSRTAPHRTRSAAGWVRTLRFNSARRNAMAHPSQTAATTTVA